MSAPSVVASLTVSPGIDPVPMAVYHAFRAVARVGGGTLRIALVPGAAFRFEADQMKPEPLDDADHGWQTTGSLSEDDLATLAGTGDWHGLAWRDIALEPAAGPVLVEPDRVADGDRLGRAEAQRAGAPQFDPSGLVHAAAPSIDRGEDAAGAAECHVNVSASGLHGAGELAR